LTHPVYATLDHPLYPSDKEGKKKNKLKSPLYACVERGDERSDVGVSRYGG